MYCPECGAQNQTGQRYCRQCGRSLSSVHLAMDGSLDEAIAGYKRGGDLLAGGAVTLVIFLVISIIAGAFGGVWAAAIDVVAGLLIAAPMLVKGILTLGRTEKKLLGEGDQAPRALNTAGQDAVKPGAGRTTDRMELQARQGNSITEGETLKLERHNGGK